MARTKRPSAQVAGANNRIQVAIVGVGFGIGQNHLTGIQEKANENNTVIMAASDVFNKRRDFAKAKANLKDADVYDDYRKLLERKDVDAVLVATHDPWHAQITMDSLDSGRHVYCEKPLTRYLGEAFEVYDTVKSSGKIFQVGSQGCSAGGYAKCAEMIKAGKIGTLVWAQAWYSRNSLNGEWNYPVENETTAANIDWERWLGPVKQRDPFSPQQYHRWRKYLPLLRRAAGRPGAAPAASADAGHGQPRVPGARGLHWHPHCPYRQERARHPRARDARARATAGRVPQRVCDHGHLLHRQRHHPRPEPLRAQSQLNVDAASGEGRLWCPSASSATRLTRRTIANLQPEEIRVHEKNWFDCIRSGKQPNANIDLAIRVQTVISLAEMSDRLKIACLFDEKTRKVTTDGGTPITPITYGTLPQS